MPKNPKKPNQREILSHFLDTFPTDKKFTQTDFRTMQRRISNLKKDIQIYIVENNIDTNKSVELIIYECIDYCAMLGKNLKSISYLNYVYPKSIEYWAKREKILAEKEKEKAEQEAKKQQQSEEEQKLAQLVAQNNEKRKQRKVPKWLQDD